MSLKYLKNLRACHVNIVRAKNALELAAEHSEDNDIATGIASLLKNIKRTESISKKILTNEEVRTLFVTANKEEPDNE